MVDAEVQISVEGAVTVVKHIVDSHDTSGLNTGRQEVLYGTHNGVLGQLFLDHQTAKPGWQMKSDAHKGDAHGLDVRPQCHFCRFTTNRAPPVSTNLRQNVVT